MTRDRVCKSFRLLSYPPGHVLFKEGDMVKCCILSKKEMLKTAISEKYEVYRKTRRNARGRRKT